MTHNFEDRITALENRRFSVTQLFYSQTGAYTTITLNDSWGKYDIIVFEICNTGEYLGDNKVDIQHIFLYTNIIHVNDGATSDNEMWDYAFMYNDTHHIATMYFRGDRRTIYIYRDKIGQFSNLMAVLSVQGIKIK